MSTNVDTPEPATEAQAQAQELVRLNESQKALVALHALPFLEAEAKERQRASGGDVRHRTVTPDLREPSREAASEAADLVGASSTMVQYAKRISQERPEVLPRPEPKNARNLSTEVAKDAQESGRVNAPQIHLSKLKPPLRAISQKAFRGLESPA